MRKLQKALIAGEKWAIRSFIGRYGTHYMRESWLGAKMITMTWMTSKSTDSVEMTRRQNCVSSVYRNQTSNGISVNTFDVNVQAGAPSGGVGVATTVGGQGWGSGNTYARDTEGCDGQGGSASYFAQNNFQRTEIVSVGALPVSNRDEWLKLTKDSPSVVKMVLAPISELFEPRYINHIDLYPHYPSRGFLDADLLKRSFTNIAENYCQFMLGEDCPPTGGCTLPGDCGDGQVCKEDPQAPNGFRCVDDDWQTVNSCPSVVTVSGESTEALDIKGRYHRQEYVFASDREIWENEEDSNLVIAWDKQWENWWITTRENAGENNGFVWLDQDADQCPGLGSLTVRKAGSDEHLPEVRVTVTW